MYVGIEKMKPKMIVIGYTSNKPSILFEFGINNKFITSEIIGARVKVANQCFSK